MNRYALRSWCGLVLAAAALVVPALVAEVAPPQPPKAKSAVDVQDFIFLAEARPVLVRVRVQADGAPVQAGYEVFLKHLFDYLDVDGNGSLSPAEAERVPPVDHFVNGTVLSTAAMFSSRGGAEGPNLKDLDADKDGKVTPAELKAHYMRLGFTPIQSEFDAMQTNQFAMAMGGAQARPTVATLGEAVFALLDTDKNGKLSPAELAAASTVLLRKDENEDDVITPRELVPPVAGKNDYIGMMSAFDDNKLVENPLVVFVHADRDLPDLARRFLKRYGPKVKDKLDKVETKTKFNERFEKAEAQATVDEKVEKVETKKVEKVEAKSSAKDLRVDEKVKKVEVKEKVEKVDAKFSRKDLGLDEKTFAALDTNGDGALDAKELAGFVKRTPDVELVVRLGTRDPDQKRLQVLGSPGIRADRVKARDHLALFELGATRMEVRGSQDARRASALSGILKAQLLAQFKQADKDRNGHIDAQEAKEGVGGAMFGSAFKAMDRDGDGKVYEKEFLAYLDKLEDLQQRARAACVTLAVEDQSSGLFDLLDTDRDGRLSVRELRNAARLLEDVAGAEKGFLKKTDLPHSYLLTLRRGPAAPGGADISKAFDQIYGGVSEEETGDSAAAGPVWFRKMDRNRDGDVSRKEFLGTVEQFREIDADGDGLISAAEAERYDARSRRKS